jgi:F0F1-type ATP synthase membrane subunit c/vacuolar-type H+-ATPase subunit K
MQNQNINAEQAYRTLVIIWAALLMSQFLFLLIIYVVKPEVFRFDFSKPLLGQDSVFIIALAGISVLNFAMSFVLRKKFLNQAVAEQKIPLVQTAMITGCALCESISLFGLLLVFLQSYQYFFLFFALAILGFILHFPRRENLIAASYKKQ